MPARSCETCVHYRPKTTTLHVDPRPYEQILAEYEAKQRPRIYTIPNPKSEARTTQKPVTEKKPNTPTDILPTRIVYKTGDLEPDSINEQWEYGENGQLRIEGAKLGNLPGSLTIDIKERLLEWDVDPNIREALSKYEFLIVPFEHTMVTYTGIVSQDMDMATLMSKGKLVMDELRKADKGGRDIIDGNPIGFGVMDCLIIKEKDPHGGLGPDRLRLNLGQRYVENVVIERVVKRKASDRLDNGLNLSPLLRRGLRRLYISPGDRPVVIPWANTLQAEGFLNHYEEVRNDGTSVMKGEAYENNEIVTAISADKKELEFSMTASSNTWDHKTGSNAKIPAKHIVTKRGIDIVEEVVASQIPVIKDLPGIWKELPIDVIAKGLITIQKLVCNPPQDLGSFAVIEIEGQPALFYLSATNHGAMNRGAREYKSILDGLSLTKLSDTSEAVRPIDESQARLSRLQSLAKSMNIDVEGKKKEDGVGNASEDRQKETVEFGL